MYMRINISMSPSARGPSFQNHDFCCSEMLYTLTHPLAQIHMLSTSTHIHSVDKYQRSRTILPKYVQGLILVDVCSYVCMCIRILMYVWLWVSVCVCSTCVCVYIYVSMYKWTSNHTAPCHATSMCATPWGFSIFWDIFLLLLVPTHACALPLWVMSHVNESWDVSVNHVASDN